MNIKQDKYHKILLESGLFFPGLSKGSFIFPPNGLILWQNIRDILDKKFSKYEVKNVALPTLIPYNFLQKEKRHIQGFSPEFFQIHQIGEKQLVEPLILRPTSEVLFYDWFQKTLRSYQQLPFLYNQWCQVFRAEKNTKPFFRNTEFFWQEGHTLHVNKDEAWGFTQKIWQEYQTYVKKSLCIAIIAGKKSEKEKFVGALETYSVECLLPDGQCLQLATSHYFGDEFCRSMEIKFQNKQNKLQNPFSTSWGTSTRAIGALALSHSDELGLVLPFDIAPVQIAFIIINPKKEKEISDYQRNLYEKLSLKYRCKIFEKNEQIKQNLTQADQEACPFKLIVGQKEFKEKAVTLVARNDLEKKTFVDEKNLIKTIEELKIKFDQAIYQKTKDFRDRHIFQINKYSQLKEKNKQMGLFFVPFCNSLSCEESIGEKIPSYSIRCLSLDKQALANGQRCIFCPNAAQEMAFLGRSY